MQIHTYIQLPQYHSITSHTYNFTTSPPVITGDGLLHRWKIHQLHVPPRIHISIHNNPAVRALKGLGCMEVVIVPTTPGACLRCQILIHDPDLASLHLRLVHQSASEFIVSPMITDLCTPLTNVPRGFCSDGLYSEISEHHNLVVRTHPIDRLPLNICDPLLLLPPDFRLQLSNLLPPRMSPNFHSVGPSIQFP